MKKSDVQTALQVLIEIHEDNDHLIALKDSAAYNSISQAQGAVAEITRYLMSIKDSMVKDGSLEV